MMIDPHQIQPHKTELFHELITDACAVLVRLVKLIPEDKPDARRYACALIVDQIMSEVQQVIDSVNTQH